MGGILDIGGDRQDLALGEVLPTRPRTGGERFDLEFDRSQAPDRFLFHEAAMHDRYEGLLDQLRARAGVRLPNPYRLDGTPGPDGISMRQRMIERINEAIDKANAQGADLADPREFPRLLAGEAQRRRAAAAEAAQVNTGVGGALAGAMLGELTHPLNLATLPLGAPWALGRSAIVAIGRTALIEAGIAGATETGVQLLDLPYRRAASTTPGLGEAGGDVLAAAGGGAIFGGGLRALAEGFRLFRRAADAADRPLTRAQADAAIAIERAAFEEGKNPFGPENSAFAEKAHEQARLELIDPHAVPRTLSAAATPPPHRIRDFPGRREFDHADPLGSIGRFVDEARREPNKPLVLDFGQLPDSVDAAIRGLGVAPQRLRHVLDANDWRHIVQQHGDATTEGLRGQLPITAADLSRLPEILRSGRVVEIVPATGSRPATLQIEARLGDLYFLIEEVRTGRDYLAVKTLYKRRGEGGGGPTAPDAGPERPPRDQRPVTDGGAATAANIATLGNRDKAYTAAGRAVETEYKVVEASRLLLSHDQLLRANPLFPRELQPRARDRAAAEAQIQEIAGRLDPHRLAASPDAGSGAPIVGPDLVVESGNGRMLAIQRAYRDRLAGAAAYRDHLRALGFDVEGMAEPVLVRARLTPLSEAERIAFAREANQSAILQLSGSERAVADARLLERIEELYQGGALDAAANRDLARKFVAAVPPGERGAMLTKDGELSREGLRRLEHAFLARAYGDADLVAKIAEAGDDKIKAIGGALLDVAPAWSRMRSLAQAEAIDPAMDATADLLAAVRSIEHARRSGAKIGDALKQQALFGEGMTVNERAFLLLMFRDRELNKPLGRAALAERLQAYVGEALKTRAGPDLFGGAGPTPGQILEAGARNASHRQAELAVEAGELAIRPKASDALLDDARAAVAERDLKIAGDGDADVTGRGALEAADREVAETEAALKCVIGASL